MSKSKTSDWVVWIPENIVNDKSFYGSIYGLLNRSTMSVYVVQGLVHDPDENMIGYIESNLGNCRDSFLEIHPKKSLFF